MSVPEALDRVERRLATRAPLSQSDRAAIRKLPFAYRTLDPAAYIVREGEPGQACVLLLTGFAFRHKVTGEGERQIMSVHLPGEFVDLQNCFLEVADHNVQTLTRCETGSVPAAAVRRLAEDHPLVAQALWIDTLIESAIFREWIVNVGRRDSLSRISHLLCEFAIRLEAAELTRDHRYELPMTQEQLADCTGLTPVHVNRVLKELGRQGLIRRNKRSVDIVDWDGLQKIGDFNGRYLHMENGGPAVPSAGR